MSFLRFSLRQQRLHRQRCQCSYLAIRLSPHQSQPRGDSHFQSPTLLSSIRLTATTSFNLPHRNHDHRHHATAFSSLTKPSSIQEETAKECERYLCQEKFPIGSLDSKHVKEMLTVFKSLTTDEDPVPERVKLAFDMLDRLTLEVRSATKQGILEKSQQEANQANQANQIVIETAKLPFSIPNYLVHDVVDAWRLCYKKQSTITFSPRDAFDKLVYWESLPLFQNFSTYKMIIQAAADSKDPDLANDILNFLLEDKSMAQRLKQDNASFTVVIRAWVASGRNDAALQAESVLLKLIALNDSSPSHRCIQNLNLVLWAWAKSTHKNAPERAEELLLGMKQRGLVPNSQSYAALLNAWARSNQGTAPEHAYAILNDMISKFDKGIIETKPDQFCFSAVISAFASRGNVHRAEQILVELYQRFQATGDKDFLPGSYCFNSAIHAWAKSGKPEAPQMAEAVLQRMQDIAEASNEPSLKPDAVSFSSVLNAWVHSKDPNAPIRFEVILQRMQYLYQNELLDCQPTVSSFNIVLDCWVKSSRKESPERAEAILRHMISLNKMHKTMPPANALSYNLVMNAWARSGHPNAGERAQAVY